MVCIAKYPPQIIKYHEEYKMYCIQYHINYPKNKVAFGVWGGRGGIPLKSVTRSSPEILSAKGDHINNMCHKSI